MRIVIQRVTEAVCAVASEGYRAEIGPGLVVLVGVEDADTEQDAAWLAGKVARMRLFPVTGGVGSQGPKGGMEASVTDTGGEVLAVSQFTLYASTRKGNRPGWSRAARREVSEPLYEAFCRALEGELGKPVARGLFGADMQVSLTNDGPVTIIMDSKSRE